MSLYLGLPQWSHPAWPGQLLGMNARPAEHLADYARVFNSVEGNTTFYASPTPETVQRWADAVPDHFRFSFKFPKEISHQSDLVSADKQVTTFIRLLAPLHDKLGLLKLQLPARFGPEGLARLDAFFARVEMLVETGFHPARVFSAPGRFSEGTKVLAMKVTGKITMNEALLTTSGVRTSRPT